MDGPPALDGASYFCSPTGEGIKQCDAVSLGPQADAIGFRERCVLDLEQGLALPVA